MKRSTIILLFLLFAGTVTHAQAAHQVYKQVSPNKITVTKATSQQLLQQFKQGGAYLLDVRTPKEFDTKHLLYARNLDIRSADFGIKVKQLDKSKQVYIYSNSGNRSGKATDSLIVLGFKKTYNIGGLDSLEKAGLPRGQ